LIPAANRITRPSLGDSVDLDDVVPGWTPRLDDLPG